MSFLYKVIGYRQVFRWSFPYVVIRVLLQTVVFSMACVKKDLLEAFEKCKELGLV